MKDLAVRRQAYTPTNIVIGDLIEESKQSIKREEAAIERYLNEYWEMMNYATEPAE